VKEGDGATRKAAPCRHQARALASAAGELCLQPLALPRLGVEVAVEDLGVDGDDDERRGPAG